MLLKTKENRSDILDDPTMLMKINDLFFEATIYMKRKGLGPTHGSKKAVGACLSDGGSVQICSVAPASSRP